MQFLERKNEAGYNYQVEDVFGKIEIDSPRQLDKGELDDLVVLLLRNKAQAETVSGEVKVKDGVVTYTFKRAPVWQEADEKEEVCESTPTSTKKLESGSTLTIRLTIPGLNWLRRFVAAFREAWKKTNQKSQ